MLTLFSGICQPKMHYLRCYGPVRIFDPWTFPLYFAAFVDRGPLEYALWEKRKEADDNRDRQKSKLFLSRQMSCARIDFRVLFVTDESGCVPKRSHRQECLCHIMVLNPADERLPKGSDR
jgi:hypothetical protein